MGVSSEKDKIAGLKGLNSFKNKEGYSRFNTYKELVPWDLEETAFQYGKYSLKELSKFSKQNQMSQKKKLIE